VGIISETLNNSWAGWV